MADFVQLKVVADFGNNIVRGPVGRLSTSRMPSNGSGSRRLRLLIGLFVVLEGFWVFALHFGQHGQN
ncbi:MAG: hypothetical protein OES84_01310, partial [Kiritimatiellaceae bacterium]|nr:hypothetical protein [Kiritimatiellaceae bacterium]